MANVKIEMNHGNMSKLLRSEEAAAVCKQYTDAAVSRLGDGYISTSFAPGKTRVNASVKAVTPEALRDQLENNTILKAVLGG